MTEPTTEEIESLRAKLGENPDSLVFAPLADALRKSGNLPEALNVCLKGLERHGQYQNARVVLGRIYQDMGQDTEAEAEFRKVLEADPDHLQALMNMGELLLKRRMHQAAIEEFQKALALNPDDEPTQALLKQAIEAAAQEQAKPATAARPPEKNPSVPTTPTKDSAATLTIAELYLKQGHYDKAIDVFQELLAEDPQNLLLRQKLSAAVELQQKHQAAAGGVASKIKKDEFTRPPEPVGDTITEETRETKKAPPVGRPRRPDDSKFTNEDILQVMLHGDKEDVVEEAPANAEPPAAPEPVKTESAPHAVEKETSAAPVSEPEPIPSAEPAPVEASDPDAPAPSSELTESQMESLKGILAELAGVEGIRGSFLSTEQGATLVSLGKAGADAASLGQSTAAIFRGTRQAVQRLSQGRTHQVLITAEAGQILLVETPKGVLVVLADDKIKIGLLRLALDTAVKKLEKIFQA